MGTADTFILQAIANIDACWTDLYAQLAIDTIAKLGLFSIAFAGSPWFTTRGVV